MCRNLKHKDTLWSPLAIQKLEPPCFFTSPEYGVPNFTLKNCFTEDLPPVWIQYYEKQVLCPISLYLRVVYHFHTFSILFNLWAGLQIYHPEEYLVWLRGRIVLVCGVTRGQSESLVCNNRLISPSHYQQDLGGLRRVFQIYSFFVRLPWLGRKVIAVSVVRALPSSLAFYFFVCWIWYKEIIPYGCYGVSI